MYCPSCGRAVQEDIRFCPHCGRPIGGHPAVTQQNVPIDKVGISNAAIAAIIVVVVAVIAVILVLFVVLSSTSGPSATVTVTVYSFTSLSTVSYDVYFGGSLVKSGTVNPFSSDSFSHTHRWSSPGPTTLVISLEASGGLLSGFYSYQETITVSDGEHYSVSMFV